MDNLIGRSAIITRAEPQHCLLNTPNSYSRQPCVGMPTFPVRLTQIGEKSQSALAFLSADHHGQEVCRWMLFFAVGTATYASGRNVNTLSMCQTTYSCVRLFSSAFTRVWIVPLETRIDFRLRYRVPFDSSQCDQNVTKRSPLQSI